jgi:ParB family chromosome partitioning protein
VQQYRGILSTTLNSKVDVKISPDGKGKLIIPFISEEDFERIVNIIAQAK